MTLEFDKIVSQVQAMGQTLAADGAAATQIADKAWERFLALPDNETIWAQIYVAREYDAGFRGAAPTEWPNSEPFHSRYPLPECPTEATLLAADGSQIYPDLHSALLYYLINIAIFVYHHSVDELASVLPEVITQPALYFDRQDLHERDGRMIANAAINARRTIFEMQMLARETLQRADSARPLIALADGPLLFWLGKEVSNAQALMQDYHEAMSVLEDLGAPLVGYVDQPRSRFLMHTLYLMQLDESEINRPTLVTTGDMEGLDDRFLMRLLLGPGDRSALVVQQSPQNKAFRDISDEREIVFFYVNVAEPGQEPYIARVEIPMWVAQRPTLVDGIHAMLFAQCQLTDRYPYVLTRADECAVIHSFEKTALDEMISIELRKRALPIEQSQKLSMKNASRAGRQTYQGL